jgi:hypothetical protein
MSLGTCTDTHSKSTYSQFLLDPSTSQLCAIKDFFGSLYAMWDIPITKTRSQVLKQATKGLLVHKL